MKGKDFEYCILYSLVVTFIATILLLGGIMFITENRMDFLSSTMKGTQEGVYGEMHKDVLVNMYLRHNESGDNVVRGVFITRVAGDNIREDISSSQEAVPQIAGLDITCVDVECQGQGNLFIVAEKPVDVSLSCKDSVEGRECTYELSRSSSKLNRNFLKLSSIHYNPQFAITSELDGMGNDIVEYIDAYLEAISNDFTLTEKLTGVMEDIAFGSIEFTVGLSRRTNFLVPAMQSYSNEYSEILQNSKYGASFFDGNSDLHNHTESMKSAVDSMLDEYNQRNAGDVSGGNSLLQMFDRYHRPSFLQRLGAKIMSQSFFLGRIVRFTSKEAVKLPEGFTALYNNLGVNESSESRAIRLRILYDYLSYRLEKRMHVKERYVRCESKSDFEGSIGNWRAEEGGWSLVDEEGNHILQGVGHKWINEESKVWKDQIFEAKLKIVTGMIHINFRMNDDGRYFIGFHEGGVDLHRQFENWNKFEDIAWAESPIQFNKWYALRTETKGNRFLIYLDNALVINATDDTYDSGTVAFETHPDSEVRVDDVYLEGICKDNR